MISRFKFSIRSSFKTQLWLGVAIALISCAASAETYPVSGVWVAKDDHFPGSTAGACLILKEFGVDAAMAQPFPSLMIFSEDRRYEVRGEYLVERTIRSVKSATGGSFQITESPLGKHWLPFSKRLFTLKVLGPTTIEITEGNFSNRFFKCSSNSPSL
jgi:hypothetical protein